MGIDPVSISLMALAVGAAGTAVSAAGQIEQGQATANAANYSAEVAANNAKIANQNAEYAINAGQVKAADSSMKGAAVLGKIRAAQAASGIDVNTGSAADVQQSQAETSKLDTETVINNADLRAYGYRSEATGFKAQSGLDTAQAEQAPIGADIGAAGSSLSNASSLAFKWSAAKPTA